MIAGTLQQERVYRALDALSQSMLKDFYDDRKYFYRKYIAVEDVEEETSREMKMGTLVDCLYFTPDQFEDKFTMSVCTEKPTAKMLDFCVALARHTKAHTDEEGIMREEFLTIAQQAHADAGYKWSLDKVLRDFSGQEPELYYRELCEALISKKIIVTANDIENGNRIVTSLRTSEFTSFLNDEGGGDVDVFHQLAISGFVIEGRPFKALLDRLEVNHGGRYLQPFDLKATWAVETFYDNYYLKLKGYLQAGTYDLACTHLRNQEYPGYDIRPMKFIVCDNVNYYNPLIYELSARDLVDCWKGFTHRGRPYKGLIELVKELNWHMDSNIWHMSKLNYENRGRVTLSSLKQP